MAFHKPRFRPIHLLDLGVVLAAEFMIWSAPYSLMMAATTLFFAFFLSVTERPSILDWLAILAAHGVMASLSLPSVQPHGGRHAKPRPATTTAPPSVKIGAQSRGVAP